MHQGDVPSAAGRSITTAPPARVVARCASVRALVDSLTSIAVFFASMDALRTASITCRVTVISHRASQRHGGCSPHAAAPPAGHQPPSSRHGPMAMATPQNGAQGMCVAAWAEVYAYAWASARAWARGAAG